MAMAIWQYGNMAGVFNDIILDLFNYPDEVFSTCNLKQECCGEVIPYVNIFIPVGNNSELMNMKMLIEQTLGTNRYCSNCHKDSNVTITLSDLVFISTFSKNPTTEFEKLNFNQIADSFQHDGKNYYLKFVINHPGVHFVAYCKLGNTLYLLDDLLTEEEIVDPPENIQPVLLAYSIYP